MEHVERTLIVDSTANDPPLQLRVESCRIDAGACMELCREALNRLKIQVSPQTCAATFEGDRASLDVTYDIYNSDGNNCPISEPGIEDAGSGTANGSGGK